MPCYHVTLHPAITVIHLTNQLYVLFRYCSHVKLFEAGQKVPFLDLRLDLRPDLVQLWVVFPVHVGFDRQREGVFEDEDSKDGLDYKMIRLL